MSASLTVAVLGLPAMFAAGLASSAHCALMCGLLQTRGAGLDMWSRHAGRAVAYALLGAISGGAGHFLLRLQDWAGAGGMLRVAALLFLSGLLLRRSPVPATAGCCAARRNTGRSAACSLVAGFVGGLVPCGLLYTAASYAALSASATQGALLMLAFGLGTVPAVSFGVWGWRQFGSGATATRPLLLAGVALSGALMLASVGPLERFWCHP